jgi:hypothetical protein
VRDSLYVAATNIDPEKTLNDVTSWCKLVVIIVLILGVVGGARKHGDGDTKGAASTLVTVAIIAVAGTIALNPFGIGTALLNIVA